MPVNTSINQPTSIDTAAQLQQLVYEMSDPSHEEYSHIDNFRHALSEALFMTKSLLHYKGRTIEEEAMVCLSLLMAFTVIYRKEDVIQKILHRTHSILPQLQPSALKCALLTYSYEEEHDPQLIREALSIARTWQKKDLTPYKRHLLTHLQNTIRCAKCI